jgi:hypothetical protein
MTIRDRIHRWHSPSLFALIALCFLLPFATVFVSGCDTSLHSSTRFTGAQLVTRTVPRGGVDPSCSHDISVCVEQAGATTADVAFGAAVIGLVLGLLGIARGPGWCAAVGLGALATLFLQFLQSPGLSEDDFSLHSGFWFTLLLFAWAGVVHLRRAWRRARSKRLKRPPASAGGGDRRAHPTV